MQILILAHRHDELACRVWRALKVGAGASEVRVVFPEDLASARWIHRVTCECASTISRWGDRTETRSWEVGAVFNRLRWMPPGALSLAGERDRDYAAQETYALWASWLHAFRGRIVNPCKPPNLGSSPSSRLAWMALAREAGLEPLERRAVVRRASSLSGAGPCLDAAHAAWTLESFPGGIGPSARRSATVIGTEVAGDAPPLLQGALERLSRLAGCPFLQVEWMQTPAGPRTLAADPFPDRCCDTVVMALSRLLGALAERHRAEARPAAAAR